MEKKIIRFMKRSAGSLKTNEEVLDLFAKAFRGNEKDSLSLASTKQTYGVLSGVDYLFFASSLLQDVPFNLLQERLESFFELTHLVSIQDLSSPNINAYAYYRASLAEISIPEDFLYRLTLLVTRDIEGEEDSLTVYLPIIRWKGRLSYVHTKKYHLVEEVPHVYYDAEKKELFFISSGNSPAQVLLAGLVFGQCEYNPVLVESIPLARLDYLRTGSRFLHNNRHYDNVLNEGINILESL